MSMITVEQIKARLRYWNDFPPIGGYNQSAYSRGADGQTYRDDCSGYVSMLTSMAGSPNTAAIGADNSTPITKDQLQFGDVLLAVPTGSQGGHVVLFDKWLDKAKTKYLGHEFGSGSAPIHREINYPYDPDGRTFVPRALNVVQRTGRPPADTPATGTPVGYSNGTAQGQSVGIFDGVQSMVLTFVLKSLFTLTGLGLVVLGTWRMSAPVRKTAATIATP